MSINEETKVLSRKHKLDDVSQAFTEEERQKIREAPYRRMKTSKEKMKHYDPVVEDRTNIEKQLKANRSVFELEVSKTMRSCCRARFCLVEEFQLGEGRRILADYRLKLKDRTSERKGSYTKRL